MRKGLIIGISLVVLLGGGFIAWIVYQQHRAQQMLDLIEREYEEETEEPVENLAENIQRVEEFYHEMDIMYRQIDSLGKNGLKKINDGSEEYKSYLISESRHFAFNFRFFPYDLIRYRGEGIGNDSITLREPWPWSLCYDLSWSECPVTDSTKLMFGDMDSYHFDLYHAAQDLPNADSMNYLHILLNYEDRDLKLFDDETIMGTTFTTAVFDGFLIVYDMKNRHVVRALPLYFTSSETINYTESDNIVTTGNAFREAFGVDLEQNFETAIRSLISDSLRIPDTRIDINEY